MQIQARLYCLYYGENDTPTLIAGAYQRGELLTLDIPFDAHPVFEVGVELEHAGQVTLTSMSWSGVPNVTFERPKNSQNTASPNRASMWRRAWVNGADEFVSWVESHRVIQNVAGVC